MARQENTGRRPEESQAEALCVQNTTFQECALFPFSKSHQQARESCTVISLVVSASQLWLAPLLLTSSDECTVSRGRTADGRVKVECLFSFCFFLVVSKVRSRFAAPLHHQFSPASVWSFFALEHLSFNEPRREKNSHLHWMHVTCMVL